MKLESFLTFVEDTKRGAGSGKGGEEQKGIGKRRAVPFLQYSPQFPLLSHSFLHATKGKGFHAFLWRSVLNCSRLPSASFRMHSVPTWLSPKSCLLSVSSLLYWGGYQISLSPVVTSVPGNWRTAVVIRLLSTLRLDLVYNNQLSSSLLNWLAQFGKSARAHSFPEASKKACAVPSQHLAYFVVWSWCA